MKKLLSILLALMMVLSVSATAFAASAITKEEAESIALKDAGYSASDVVRIKTEREFDDGREIWNVDFVVEEDGLYKDFDYEILASDGKIIEKDWEYEDDYFFSGNIPSLSRIEQLLMEIIALLKALLG